MKQVKVSIGFFIALILLALFFIVAGPFIQILAINTLFKTSIEYSWINWCCVMILNSSIGAVSYRGK